MKSVKNVIKKIIGVGGLTPEDLRKRGAIIGKNVSINTKEIDLGHGFLITIGDNVTIAADAMILTHDASTKRLLGYSKIGRIVIKNNVFIGARSVVLPNVCIGENVIIGAGSVVTSDIPDNCVAVGNPCRRIYSYEEFVRKNKELFDKSPRFEHYWANKTMEEKEEMKNVLQIGQIGFDP